MQISLRSIIEAIDDEKIKVKMEGLDFKREIRLLVD